MHGNGEVMRLMHKSKGRTALIVLFCIVGVIVVALLIIYLYIHNMISKINIVNNTGSGLASEAEKDASTNSAEDGEDKKAAQADSINQKSVINSDNSQEKNADNQNDEDTMDLPGASQDEIADIEEIIQSNINKGDIKYDKDVFNILLIGSDSRKTGGTGRSDAMILISVNKKKKTITATSILRDIYLKIPGRDKNNRINTAFAYGGADLLLDTIEQNFRIKVDKYATIDFYAFIEVVDAVGGVTLNVTKEDIPVINGYVMEINRLTGKKVRSDCLTKAGTLLLNGKQALGYSRNRYVGNSDFSRTAKQREILEQVYNKVKKLKISEITDLLNSILPQITTNLKEGEIFSLLLSLPSYIKYDIKQGTIPSKGTYKNMSIRGMSVLGIDFDKNIDKLYESIYAEDNN
jgi:LCP family protein required for cell wall assembly